MSEPVRRYGAIDHLFAEINHALTTVFAKPSGTGRDDPAADVGRPVELTPAEQQHIGRLMRVNHAGEVAAQALYRGQRLFARDPQVQTRMVRAAAEENDHLAWTAARLAEADIPKSHINPLWYSGAFTIGSVAALAGDKWSLGFVRETEEQVVEHLERHLERMPSADTQGRAVLEQMQVDEARHGEAADRAGAANLPAPIRGLMRLSAKVMTRTAYWV